MGLHHARDFGFQAPPLFTRALKRLGRLGTRLHKHYPWIKVRDMAADSIYTIVCISVECVQVLLQSLNLAAMFVRMANTSVQGIPLLYPAQTVESRDQYACAYVLFYSIHARLRVKIALGCLEKRQTVYLGTSPAARFSY